MYVPSLKTNEIIYICLITDKNHQLLITGAQEVGFEAYVTGFMLPGW